MSVFGNIMSAIFGRSSSAAAAPTTASAGTPPAPQAAPSAPAAPTGSPTSPVDVEAIMDNLAAQSSERLNWRQSIVDLMKLVKPGQQPRRPQRTGPRAELFWGHERFSVDEHLAS